MENDRLLEAIKEYFNEYFNTQEKKLEAIEKKLNEVLEQNKDLNLNLDMINDNLRDNGTMLQSVHKGGMTFLLQLESLRTYIQQRARANSWKLPEKRKKPPAVE